MHATHYKSTEVLARTTLENDMAARACTYGTYGQAYVVCDNHTRHMLVYSYMCVQRSRFLMECARTLRYVLALGPLQNIVLFATGRIP